MPPALMVVSSAKMIVRNQVQIGVEFSTQIIKKAIKIVRAGTINKSTLRCPYRSAWRDQNGVAIDFVISAIALNRPASA